MIGEIIRLAVEAVLLIVFIINDVEVEKLRKEVNYLSAKVYDMQYDMQLKEFKWRAKEEN